MLKKLNYHCRDEVGHINWLQVNVTHNPPSGEDMTCESMSLAEKSGWVTPTTQLTSRYPKGKIVGSYQQHALC